MENEIKFITPKKDSLKINGDLSYGEGQRAWSVLRIKKEILSEFSQLKKRRENFGYQMLFCRESKDFEKEVRKLKKEGKVLPILLWFYQKESEKK